MKWIQFYVNLNKNALTDLVALILFGFMDIKFPILKEKMIRYSTLGAYKNDKIIFRQ